MTAKILVVDDEPDLEALILQRFRRKIQAAEFHFDFARNGVEALEKIRGNADIDLVLTDINMPEMDGLTLLLKLAELDGLRKSVVISAYDDMGNIRKAMNHGAFDFLTKPIDFRDLDVTIEKALREQAAAKEAWQTRDQLVAIQRELCVATKIQQSILPQGQSLFRERREFEICAQMIPARAVGGDFYDYFLLDPERVGFVIADVSGKGVPAAIFMAMTRSLLKATALTGLPAGECLRHVNRLLCVESDSGLFVTLFYGILHTRTGELEYSQAGHAPPYLLDEGGRLAVVEDRGGMVLGVVMDNEYPTGRIRLRTGESLFLYTDGVTDAMDAGQNFFSIRRLEAFLRQSGQSALPDIVQGAVGLVREFSAGAPQADDITILATRYLGPGGS